MSFAVVSAPVFVAKWERGTTATREFFEKEARRHEELEKRRLEERRLEAKKVVLEEIRKDEGMQKNLEAMEAGIGAADELDDGEADDYEACKAREIERGKRRREDRKKEEVKMLRRTTEEKPLPQPTQKKWSSMQRYYHKGAFFQSDALPPPLGPTASTLTTSRQPLGRRRLIRRCFPRSCGSGILGAAAGRSGRIYLRKIRP